MLFILDASAILNDFGFEFKKQHSYLITNAVLNELKDIRSRNLAENALKTSRLKITDPVPDFFQKAGAIAIGFEERHLSPADKSILALCLETREKGQKFVFISDDHALQRICKRMGIECQGIIRGKPKKPKNKQKP